MRVCARACVHVSVYACACGYVYVQVCMHVSVLFRIGRIIKLISYNSSLLRCCCILCDQLSLQQTSYTDSVSLYIMPLQASGSLCQPPIISSYPIMFHSQN